MADAPDQTSGENQQSAVESTDLVIPPKRRRSTESRATSHVSWDDLQSCWSGDTNPPVIKRRSITDQTTTQLPASDSMEPTKEVTSQAGLDVRIPDGNSTARKSDSIGSIFSGQPTVVNTTHNVQQINQGNTILEHHLKAVEEITATRLKEMDSKIETMQQENQHIAQTANALVKSLQNALVEMDKTHLQHEQVIQKNDNTVANLIQHSQVLWDRNKLLEEGQFRQQQALEQSAQQNQVLNQQAQVLWTGQEESRGQQSSTEVRMQQLHQELAQMKESNRNRPTHPISGKVLQPSNAQKQKDAFAAHGKDRPVIEESSRGKGPIPTIPEQWERYPPPYYANPIYMNQPDWNWGNYDFSYMNQPSVAPDRNHPTMPRVSDPGKITADSHGFDPLPSYGYPNMMIDPCHGFTPNTFQNWKREVKLRIAGMPGATTTQILAKLIHALPLSTKTDALLYMESTEKSPESRTVDHVMRIMDVRYGRTDSERACSWLAAFTEFKRESNENYKDYWARFSRCAAKMSALDMPMTRQVIFNRAIQALRLPEGQLPIVLSALESRPDRFSVDSLREMTIRIYETHRPKIDTAGVFAATTNQTPGGHENDESNSWAQEDQEDDDSWDDSVSVTLESGAVFLMKPKKPQKPRNAPGMNEAARRGAVSTFRNVPNQRAKGGTGGCLRCGDPSHHWKECPHPFRERLDPRITAKVGYKGKGKPKGKATYMACEPESCESVGQPTSLDERVPINEPIVPDVESSETPINPAGRSPSINDVWAQYYAQFHESSPNVVAVCSTRESFDDMQPLSPIAVMMAKTNQKPDELPPILIDSGASSTVVGKKWFQSWKGFNMPELTKSHKEFHFGDGPAYPSLGTCQLNLIIPEKFLNQPKKYMLVIQVDVVAAVVPMLISQNALARMAGKIDFAKNTLELPTGLLIHLIKSPSGHILLPAAPVSHMEVDPFVPELMERSQ